VITGVGRLLVTVADSSIVGFMLAIMSAYVMACGATTAVVFICTLAGVACGTGALGGLSENSV
jgi:hypothetical protein